MIGLMILAAIGAFLFWDSGRLLTRFRAKRGGSKFDMTSRIASASMALLSVASAALLVSGVYETSFYPVAMIVGLLLAVSVLVAPLSYWSLRVAAR